MKRFRRVTFVPLSGLLAVALLLGAKTAEAGGPGGHHPGGHYHKAAVHHAHYPYHHYGYYAPAPYVAPANYYAPTYYYAPIWYSPGCHHHW